MYRGSYTILRLVYFGPLSWVLSNDVYVCSVCMCVCVYACVRMHACVYACMHVRVGVGVHVCLCVHLCNSHFNSSGVSPTLEELVDVRIFPLVEDAKLSELSFTRYFMLLDDGMNRAGLIETGLLGS